MSTAPTLYFLTVTERLTGGYEIWESHRCQERGCVTTEPEFDEFIRELKNKNFISPGSVEIITASRVVTEEAVATATGITT